MTASVFTIDAASDRLGKRGRPRGRPMLPGERPLSLSTPEYRRALGRFLANLAVMDTAGNAAERHTAADAALAELHSSGLRVTDLLEVVR